MNFDFDDCYWHDSVLESVFIDRSNPGYNDSVEMVIDWCEEQPKSRLIFKKAYPTSHRLMIRIYSSFTRDGRVFLITLN